MGETRPKRKYDSSLRRQRAAETRERIIASGAELLHGLAVWNWHALTVRDVAAKTGVNERTIYRHFANEHELWDAVLARLQEESGVDLAGLRLEDVRGSAARILQFLSTFPLEPRTTPNPTLTAVGRRNRELLLAAVTSVAADWPERDRTLAAAMLDVLWSVTTYERLAADWKLEPEEAIRGATWALGILEDAIRTGRRPERC